MRLSKKMDNFGENVFTTLQIRRNDRIARGLPIFDLSIGTPNVPPTPRITEILSREAADPANYIYAVTDLQELREAGAIWYKNRFGVTLDPKTQISSLLGSQEGLAHIAFAVADPGDIMLVPDPCYPVFGHGPMFAGAELYYMPMKRENGYIIQLRDIPTDVAKRAKMITVSYPNNPTTAIAPPEFYRDLIAFAREFDIIVLHDNAYSDLVFDGAKCSSFLAYEGAMDLGVEFNSLSKTYGLAGARVGFCFGNSQIVSALKNLKSNLDYGIFLPIQKAAISAITGDQSCVEETCKAYERRRDCICDGLTSIGWEVPRSPATMFVWAKIPEKYSSSSEFTLDLLDRTGVLVTPGGAFGPSGEGYVRLAFVQEVEDMKKAVAAIKESGILN